MKFTRNHSKEDVRIALRKLLEKLNDTYDETMDRIYSQDSNDAQLAQRVLSWMFYALRPLSLEELRYALAIEPGTRAMDLESLPDEDLVVALCAGLVTVEHESRLVCL